MEKYKFNNLQYVYIYIYLSYWNFRLTNSSCTRSVTRINIDTKRVLFPFFLQACDCKQRDYSNNNPFSCTEKQIFTKINKFPSKYQLERFRTTIHFISNGSLLYFHSPRSRFLSHDPWFNDFNTKGVSFSLPFFLFFIDLRR